MKIFMYILVIIIDIAGLYVIRDEKGCFFKICKVHGFLIIIAVIIMIVLHFSGVINLNDPMYS